MNSERVTARDLFDIRLRSSARNSDQLSERDITGDEGRRSAWSLNGADACGRWLDTVCFVANQ